MKRRIKGIYDLGGFMGNLPIGDLLQLGSGALSGFEYDESGYPSKGAMTVSSAFRGAGTGFGIGNAILPGIGGLVGGGVGALIGGLTGNSRAKELQEQARKERRGMAAMRRRIKEDEESEILQHFPTEGVYASTYFAGGGMMGGKLKPLAPGIDEVSGRTHETGGVDLPNGAEVEDDEIIKDGQMVFTARTKVPGTNMTYAQAARKIAMTPRYKAIAKKESQLESVVNNLTANQYQRGTAARRLMTIENPLTKLFNLQEMAKAYNPARKFAPGGLMPDPYYLNKFYPQNIETSQDEADMAISDYNWPVRRSTADLVRFHPGYPEKQWNDIMPPPLQPLPHVEYGAVPRSPDLRTVNAYMPPAADRNESQKFFPSGIIGKAVENVAPFIDNIVNALLTRRTPNIPAPTYLRAPSLKTTFNVEPQLADIRRMGATRNRALLSSTANPQSVRANIIAGSAADQEAVGRVLAQKQNTETDLQNRAAMINYENRMANARNYDAYRMQQVLRQDDIAGRTSANVANLSEDLTNRRAEGNMAMRDRQALALLVTNYANSGVLDRAQVMEIMDAIEKGENVSSVMRRLALAKRAE